MASSSGDHMRGAAEHMRTKVFEGILAFSNLGLAGRAVTSKTKWPRHSARLHTLVTDLFTAAAVRGRTLWGILLCEVGSMSDHLDMKARLKFDGMLTKAFGQS